MSAVEEREAKTLIALTYQPWLGPLKSPYYCTYLRYSPRDWFPNLDEEIEAALVEESSHGRS